MKCNSKIFFYKKTNKDGTRKIKASVCPWYSPQEFQIVRSRIVTDKVDPNWEICDGKIIADVEAVNEPDYGGSYAALNVTYKCNKCGQMSFPDLPNEFTISEFLTDIIEKMEDNDNPN